MTNRKRPPRENPERLKEQLRAMADTLERSDAHDHMDVAMAFTQAGDLLRDALAALEQATEKQTRAVDDERRRWYRALAWLGDLGGLAPEVVAKQAESALASARKELQELREFRRDHVDAYHIWKSKNDWMSRAVAAEAALAAAREERDRLKEKAQKVVRLTREGYGGLILSDAIDALALAAAGTGKHEPMGIHAPQWCAACSQGKPMSEWVTWPCALAATGTGEGAQK